jgi:hypothetical protein
VLSARVGAEVDPVRRSAPAGEQSASQIRRRAEERRAALDYVVDEVETFNHDRLAARSEQRDRLRASADRERARFATLGRRDR